jgi:hypothetical protein
MRYVMAGRAIFTLRSVETQKRYTFKVSRWKKNPAVSFVNLLTGTDNTNDYRPLGILQNNLFRGDRRSVYNKTSECYRAFDFFYRWLQAKPEMTEKIEFWHSGRCGHCGKQLTVPESIALGIGPICAGKM